MEREAEYEITIEIDPEQWDVRKLDERAFNALALKHWRLKVRWGLSFHDAYAPAERRAHDQVLANKRDEARDWLRERERLMADFARAMGRKIMRGAPRGPRHVH